MRSYAWIGTTGGPHLLLADEQLPYWRGIDQWRDCEKYPTNQSDYARACSVTTWLGSIPCHRGSAVVLSGDAGDIAWYTDGEDDRGFLVQRIGVDNERLIEPALHTPQLRDLLKSSGAECLHLETGASGTMWLMDASDRGSDLRSVRQALALRPGVYLARAAYYSAAGLMIVVREICWIKPLPTKVS